MRSPNIQYRQGLDHLRGLAAGLIVFYHGLHLLSLFPRATQGDLYQHWIHTTNPLLALIEEGHSAVGFFMVLSGFLFSVSSIGKQIVYGAFLKNRVLRILPLYVFMLLVGAVAFPTSYSLLGVLQALLFQADFPGSFQAGAITAMFWAVGVEFQLYLLFPFLHRFVERYGMRWALGCIALCLLMRLLATLVGTSNARDIAYSHLLGRMDQFLIGMLTARVFKRVERLALPWGALCAASTALMLAVMVGLNQLGGYPKVALWKIVWPPVEALTWAQLIVTYTVFAERIPGWLSRPLTSFGTVSYSVYLLHNACLVVMPRLWYPRLSTDPDLAALLYVLVCVLPVLLPLAYLSYHVIERPFLAMRVHYLRAVSETTLDETTLERPRAPQPAIHSN